MPSPEVYQLTRKIYMLMGMLTKVGRQSLETRLRKVGIEVSGLHIGVLRILNFDGSQTLSDLSRKMMVDPSTLVPSVDGLERRNLVKRERDPQDRRRVQIHITPEGNQLVEQVGQIEPDDLVYLSLERMGIVKAQQFTALLEELLVGMPDHGEMMAFIQARMQAFDQQHLSAHNCNKTKEE